VVAVLRPCQPVHPSSWTISSNAAQVHGDDLVDDLGLAIRLGMKRRAHAELHARQPKEIPPDVAREHRVTV
uniref:Uncharacterized protein n=1 Tax=Triticum urartu TaxID=4572 RepID=A0A8R7TJV7_TRIUA